MAKTKVDEKPCQIVFVSPGYDEQTTKYYVRVDSNKDFIRLYGFEIEKAN